MSPLAISYEDAIVTHANKYNQNAGIVVSFLFFSNLYQDVVFKLENSGIEYPTTFKNLNLPLYTQQHVSLIAINNTIVAYADKQTSEYYYLTNNLQKALGYGFNFNWYLVTAIIAIGYFIIATKFEIPQEIGLVVLVVPVLLRVYQLVSNYLLQRKIDKLITAS